jgi:hypothetical protein
LVGKTEEEGPLGKHRGRLEDNIKMYLEKEWGQGLGLAQYRERWRIFLNVARNCRVL